MSKRLRTLRIEWYAPDCHGGGTIQIDYPLTTLHLSSIWNVVLKGTYDKICRQKES